ncbi:polar amino acid transport system permease protein [Rhodococcus sp. 27YEA15]|uniref:amino acid ABC transporter permease n=1 Tax=Rhodococcus sp. 27YEA15 TaxID=3156259 RepID=UPI003C7A9C2E
MTVRISDNGVDSAGPNSTRDTPSRNVDVAAAAARRRPGRLLLGTAVVAISAALAVAIARNPSVEWSVVFRYLTYPSILEGVWTTVWLTVSSMVLGTVGGTILALCRNSSNPLVRLPADVYVWFFRGTPLLIQLIFWFNFAIFLPRVEIAIPFTNHYIVSESTNDLIKPLVAALLGLALHEAAYMCEIVRAGILSVPHGQTEAASTLGLTSSQIAGQIVLPQAMRVIIPPAGNQAISMLKATSLVSVMSVFDLFYSAQTLYTNNGKIIPLLVVAALWYLALTSVLYVVQSRIEIRYGRGVTRRRTDTGTGTGTSRLFGRTSSRQSGVTR